MNIVIVLVLLSTIFFVCSTSQAGVFEDLIKYRYLDNVNQIQYSDIYTPEQNIQSNTVWYNGNSKTGKIRGWVDIVGYTNMVKTDNRYYINDSNSAIIQHDVWAGPMGRNNYCDYIRVTNEQVTTTENLTTAKIDIEMLWHHSSRSATGGIRKSYYYEYTTFADTEIVPKRFPGINCSNTSIEIIIYNNTVVPKTTIKLLNIPTHTFFINYTYDNETIIHHFGTASQEHTDKNCPYMNITWTDCWENDGNLSQFNGFVIVPDMNYSNDNLTVTFNDPYISTKINNTTVYELKYHGINNVFSPLFWVFISIVFILVGGSYVQLRRLKCR